MINFNFEKAAIYKSLIFGEFFPFKFAKIISRLFYWLFVFSFLIFIYFTFIAPQNNYFEYPRVLTGFSLIFAALAIFFKLLEKFTEQKIKNPKVSFSVKQAILYPEKYNLAEILSFDSAKAVAGAFRVFRLQKIGSGHLLYSILDNPKVVFIFSRLILDIQEIKEAIEKQIKQGSLKRNPQFSEESFEDVILESLKIAEAQSHSKIEIGDLLIALSRKDEIFKNILIFYKLKTEDIENMVWLVERVEEKAKKRKRFWEYENLAKGGTLAKAWIAGYTTTLDKFSIDLTKTIKESITEVVVHKEEVERVERALSKAKMRNVLLVGDTGSGKKSIIHALAHKSIRGLSLPEVNYKRFVELDMQSLIAKTKSIEEVEALLETILKEVIFAGNIILIINEFHNYISQAQKPGVIDIAGILSSYLQNPNFQFIAITTFDGLARYIEKNPGIAALFEKVEVAGITDKETLLILESLLPAYERKYKIFISYPALREIINLTSRYMAYLPFPDKALDILSEAVILVAREGRKKIMLPEHISKIITQRTEIPVGMLAKKEKEVLLNLENLIHQRIINQEEAVKEVSAALRRARADITIRKGPMGVFLFLGPTGVGKTETSKALAEFYFGAEDKMVRLDMSEFQQVKDIDRLLGSVEEPGLLTDSISENPFSLLLLDEFEKAHANILNLFLQIFDEGYVTDGTGRKVDFKNTIIIATSNAGYQIILEAIKEKAEWGTVKEKILDYLYKEGKFRPELINRFDAVVVFRPLTKENLLDIAQLLLSKLHKNLKEKGIEFVITEPLKEKIVELGYNPLYGAREMRRVIQDKVENVLAQALIAGKISGGNKVKVNPQNFELIID